MRSFHVTHEVNKHLAIKVGDVEVARYIYEPEFPASEARKPYLHPLRTLTGAPASTFRPWDHPWHKGIQMTASVLSGENFWGGKSYSNGEYLWFDNIGQMKHETLTSLETTDEEVRVVESLGWITAAGERWIEETRELRFHGVDHASGTWALDFSTELHNVRGAALEMGSPTTLGRPNAGYTGFFWRGPRSWTGGDIIAAGGGAGEEMMGKQAPWLAITGRHDGLDGGAAVLFFSGQSSASVPIKWFVRSQPFAAINPSPSFDEVVTIEPASPLRLQHRVVVIDGLMDRRGLEGLARRYAP